MTSLPEEMEILKRFHGHLGPYVVVGYRMGALARRYISGKLHAIVHTGNQRPLSCLVDGVQFSSSCTLGKGNIFIVNEGKPVADFVSDEINLSIELNEKVRKEIERRMTRETEEAIAIEIFNLNEDELFNIKISTKRSEQSRSCL